MLTDPKYGSWDMCFVANRFGANQTNGVLPFCLPHARDFAETSFTGFWEHCITSSKLLDSLFLPSDVLDITSISLPFSH
jgi:hypothetical protein